MNDSAQSSEPASCRRTCVAEVHVFDDEEALGETLANEIVDVAPALLGCPGGRSLLSTYRALASSGADLSRTTIVMMDEYVPVPPPPAHYSCRGFALREIAGPLGIPEDRVWLPDPDDPSEFEERIEAAGGI